MDKDKVLDECLARLVELHEQERLRPLKHGEVGWMVKRMGLWKGRAPSFQEFVDQNFVGAGYRQILKSIDVHRHYIEHLKLPESLVAETGVEKAVMLISLAPNAEAAKKEFTAVADMSVSEVEEYVRKRMKKAA